MIPSSSRHPQHEIDHDSRKQCNREHRRSQPIIETALASLPNALRSPVEREKGVNHGGDSHKGEQAGADLADLVTEIEEADS